MRRPYVIEHEPMAYVVALVAVVIFLIQLLVSMKCTRERVALALAIGSFAFALVRPLLLPLSAAATSSVRFGLLLLWIAALLVSLSLLRSAVASDGRPTSAEQ